MNGMTIDICMQRRSANIIYNQGLASMAILFHDKDKAKPIPCHILGLCLSPLVFVCELNDGNVRLIATDCVQFTDTREGIFCY